jgi:hypothetical protein
MPAELTNMPPSWLIAGIVGAIALVLILVYLKLKLSGRGEVLTFMAFCFMCITAMWLITFMYAPAIFWGITGIVALALVSWLFNSLAKIGQGNRAIHATERIHNRSLVALEAGADREAVVYLHTASLEAAKALAPADRQAISSSVEEGTRLVRDSFNRFWLDVPGYNQYQALPPGFGREQAKFMVKYQQYVDEEKRHGIIYTK